jgi:hypothetical protein
VKRLIALSTLLLIACTLAPGCVPVKPYQRAVLAKPFMAFHEDTDEETLDLHMLEAREGSTGGYGSAGGGCGCN